MSGADQATAALRFSELSGGYGDTCVLRSISASVHAGEVLGVAGRNGVGKTTLVRLLAGLLPTMGGSVRYDDHEVRDLPTHQRQRLGIAYMPQEGLVFDPLTVRENLTLHRHDRSLDCYESLFEIFPQIRSRLDLKSGHLSGGEKKLVGFMRVMADEAPVTLLDEPSEGVQPENIAHMRELIGTRCKAGGAFLIVEQNLSFLMQVMNSILVLDHGQSVFEQMSGPFDRELLISYLHV